MAQVIRFPSGPALFEPDMTRAMAEAFDAVCLRLDLHDPAAREAVAARIIDYARQGEHDAGRLRDRALRDLTADRSAN